jgi:hypothetical protein
MPNRATEKYNKSCYTDKCNIFNFLVIYKADDTYLSF